MHNLLIFMLLFPIFIAEKLQIKDFYSSNSNLTDYTQNSNSNKQISQDQIKCNAKCRNNALCFQICQNGIGTTQIIIIIGSILSFILLLVCFGVICNFGFLMHLPCHHFQRLKQTFNVVENYSKNGNYTNGDNMKVQAHAAIERSSSFLVELKITGKDFKDRWRGVGFVVCKSQGQIFFWMYKIYNSKLANKGGLVLETSKTVDEDGSIEGVWSYIENENQKGQWKLESKQSKSSQIKYIQKPQSKAVLLSLQDEIINLSSSMETISKSEQIQ